MKLRICIVANPPAAKAIRIIGVFSFIFCVVVLLVCLLFRCTGIHHSGI